MRTFLPPKTPKRPKREDPLREMTPDETRAHIAELAEWHDAFAPIVDELEDVVSLFSVVNHLLEMALGQAKIMKIYGSDLVETIDNAHRLLMVHWGIAEANIAPLRILGDWLFTHAFADVPRHQQAAKTLEG